jgi:threonine dehydratase
MAAIEAGKHVYCEWPLGRTTAEAVELAALAKVVAEGAGALSFAALEQLAPGPPTVAVISGGNLDRELLGALLAD